MNYYITTKTARGFFKGDLIYLYMIKDNMCYFNRIKNTQVIDLEYRLGLKKFVKYFSLLPDEKLIKIL